jgi:hypothetical protein
MTFHRSFIISGLLAAVLTVMTSIVIAAPVQPGGKGTNSPDKSKQNDKAKNDEEQAPELVTPNFMSSKYGFGVYVPEGYTSTVSEEPKVWKYTPEGGTKSVTQKVALWMLGIGSTLGDTTQPSARLTIERLPDQITDVGGFWKLMKDRDLVMSHNTTYERITKVAGSGAIQTRVERMEGSSYVLAILWVWVHDGYGYTLTGYPPQSGDNSEARELARDLIDQFRWMTKDEIEAAKKAPAAKPPAGTKPKSHPGQAF